MNLIQQDDLSEGGSNGWSYEPLKAAHCASLQTDGRRSIKGRTRSAPKRTLLCLTENKLRFLSDQLQFIHRGFAPLRFALESKLLSPFLL